MLIGISARATVGKDTFASLLSEAIAPKKFVRVAFADALKAELEPFFQSFGSSAYESDPVKKNRIRPILVSYGVTQRVVSNGWYWINKVEPTVKAELEKDSVVVVTDVRFPNEAAWIKSLGGTCLYLNRPDVPPANDEEAFNDPLIRAKADYMVDWPTSLKNDKVDLDNLKNIVHAWLQDNNK